MNETERCATWKEKGKKEIKVIDECMNVGMSTGQIKGGRAETGR